MRYSRNLKLGMGASALAMAIAGQPHLAAAQDADDNFLDVITVTARKKVENLQDIPLSVGVITARDIQRLGIDSVSDIAGRTVGFALETFSGPLTQPSIRGQVQLRTTSPVQNVVTYLDGVYLQAGYMIDQALTDVQRVEIIKGPQSALFGRNAFAGVIDIETVDPSMTDIGITAVGTIGTDDRYDIGGSLSLPVIEDKLAVSFAYNYSEFDGTWENQAPLADDPDATTRGNLGGYEKESFMFKVIAKPVETIRFEGMFLRTDRFLESNPTYTIATPSNANNNRDQLNASPISQTLFGFTSTANRLFVGELPVLPPIQAGDTRPEGLSIDPRAFGQDGPTEVWSAKVDWDVTDSIVASYQYGRTTADITALGSSTWDPAFGTTFGPPDQNVNLFDASVSGSGFKGESHEVRVDYSDGPIRAMIGMNYSSTEDQQGNATGIGALNSLEQLPPLQEIAPGTGSFSGFGPTLFGPLATNASRTTLLQREEEILAIFAFLSYEPMEGLVLTAEGRYTDEDQRAVDFWTADPDNGALQNPNPPEFERNSSYFTPRVTATYQYTPDNMVYGNVARGVKSGGFNGLIPFVPQRTYEDETNWTFEIGSKNTFMDGSLQLNFAAFYTSWRNLQTNAGRLNADGVLEGSAFFIPSVTGNVGGVNVMGIEVDGFYRPIEELRISYGLSYNRAKYTDDSVSQRFGTAGNCDGIVCEFTTGQDFLGNDIQVLDIGGNSLERRPDWEGMLAVDYDREIATDVDFNARVDMNWQSKQFAEEANLATIASRLLFNASTGVTYKNVDVRLWVNNVFNKKYVANSLFLVGTGGFLTASYVPFLGEQRTGGLTVRFNY